MVKQLSQQASVFVIPGVKFGLDLLKNQYSNTDLTLKRKQHLFSKVVLVTYANNPSINMKLNFFCVTGVFVLLKGAILECGRQSGLIVELLLLLA